MWVEHKATCQQCGWSESWTNRDAAQSAAVWHVYSDHRETWRDLAGDRLPADLPATLLGRKLEDWESQL